MDKPTFVVKVSKCDRNDKTKSWDIGFAITHPDGVEHFVPITIYEYELINPTIDRAMKVAVGRTLPVQFAMYYTTKHANDEEEQFEDSDSSPETLTNG
jgi:hypothetical protein